LNVGNSHRDTLFDMSTRLSDLTDQHLPRLRALDAARFLSASHEAQTTGVLVEDVFRQRWPRSMHLDVIQRHITKAAVGAAPSAWGSQLVSPPELVRGLLDVTRPLTILGRLAARQVPLNVAVPVVTTAVGGFRWIGGGQAIRVSRAALERATLRPAMLGGLIITSKELLRLGTPGAADMLVDHLASGAAAFTDASFVDPTQAGSVDPPIPAALTYGVTPSGTSTGDPHEDLLALLSAYRANGGSFSSCVILISSFNAAALALRSGADGAPQFPNLTTSGGTLAGCPCLASDAVGEQLIAFDVRRLLVADPGEMDVAIAQAAAIEMSDDASQSSATGTGASLTSMFQTNSVAIRITRHLNWSYHGAIAIVDGCDYLTMGSPS
jgi:HK97 family phage major capsid protein